MDNGNKSIRKLVWIDPDSGRIIDIDQSKLKLVSEELIEYLDNELDLKNDIHEIKKYFYPLCSNALNGKIRESIPSDKLPLQYQRRERLFDEDLNRLLARFCVTISGTPLEDMKLEYVSESPHAYINY